MRKRGFTFLELLIAISLFAVGMVSILQIFPVNRRFLAQSASTTQAVFLAQEALEQARSVPYDNLTIGTYQAKAPVSTVSGDPFAQYQRQVKVTILDGTRAAIAQQDTAHDVGLKRLDVTVYWNERGINRQYSLSTYATE